MQGRTRRGIAAPKLKRTREHEIMRLVSLAKRPVPVLPGCSMCIRLRCRAHLRAASDSMELGPLVRFPLQCSPNLNIDLSEIVHRLEAFKDGEKAANDFSRF